MAGNGPMQYNFAEFAWMLEKTKLKVLDLSGIQISNEDGIIIAESIALNKSLENLNLRNNLL